MFISSRRKTLPLEKFLGFVAPFLDSSLTPFPLRRIFEVRDALSQRGPLRFFIFGTQRNFDLSHILQRTTRTVNRWPLWQLFRRVMVRPVFRESLWRGLAGNQ